MSITRKIIIKPRAYIPLYSTSYRTGCFFSIILFFQLFYRFSLYSIKITACTFITTLLLNELCFKVSITIACGKYSLILYTTHYFTSLLIFFSYSYINSLPILILSPILHRNVADLYYTLRNSVNEKQALKWGANLTHSAALAHCALAGDFRL